MVRGVFERVGAGMIGVVVVTDTFMQNGAGATCRFRLEGFPVAAVLYYQAMSLMCFPFYLCCVFVVAGLFLPFGLPLSSSCMVRIDILKKRGVADKTQSNGNIQNLILWNPF